jgi:cell division protein FtsL
MAPKTSHAYKQTPWRIQLRRIVWILTVVVIFLLVAVSNLNVSAKTYATGVDIQRLEARRDDLTRQIADQKNKLAYLTSIEVMDKRASEENFVSIEDPQDVIYLSVPGYQPPGVEYAAPKAKEVPQPILKPAYTQSIWELFIQGALKLNDSSLGAVK